MKTSIYPIILIAILFELFGCGHYRVLRTDGNLNTNLVLGDLTNRTDFPDLSSFVRNAIAQLAYTEHMSNRGKVEEESIATINIEIVSYDITGIGEVRIESDDSDQRKYRSSIFNVTVDFEYYLANSQPVSRENMRYTVQGKAEFTELIDIALVKKDALQQAAYDGCRQIMTSVLRY